MKYDWEFKYQCVLDYKAGKEIPLDNFNNRKQKRNCVTEWVRIFDIYGIEGLKHKTFNKVWTKEEKYEFVARVLAGKSRNSVAIESGICSGLLYHWIKRYKEFGYDGLELKRKGRPPKEGAIMVKKKESSSKLTQSEKEELILLRKRKEYLEAENAYLKKLAALTAKKKAESSAKAKKQLSSKDS